MTAVSYTHLDVYKRQLKYLERRGLSRKTIDMFQLGYAPAEWEFITAGSARAGIEIEYVVKAGLALQRSQEMCIRDRGKPAVVGCESLRIDLEGNIGLVGNVTLNEGDIISIDGGTGSVFLGEVPLVEPSMGEEFKEILGWADDIRELGVNTLPKSSFQCNFKRFGYTEPGLGFFPDACRFGSVDTRGKCIKCSRGRGAVSYTHLDVYKRQLKYLAPP